MGGIFSTNSANSQSQSLLEPTDEDRVMAGLTIPVLLEKNLALRGGCTDGGFPVAEALTFDQSEVPNLYSTSEGQLEFTFQEHGVAYNETDATDCLVEAKVPLGESLASFTLAMDPTPVQMWGVNFAGRVLVKHQSGEERVIYLPGTRTYDPAGLTGDPHASERIGPSCSRTQVGISVAELTAALKGAELEQVHKLHDQIRKIVVRYHGREVLFDWMVLQVEDAVYKNNNVTPYPEYIKTLMREGKFEVSEPSRDHTREYLDSYNRGLPHPPVHYYRKVAKKDKVGEILKEQELATFTKIVE